ncbi:hypothetical protein MTR67_049590 [Solanum verrucosum]|uniref:Uncharacterized protein n=1 Tax=Solanum verrucosum TaxID=315347 RepID=A0AAF0V1P6_SOLVR|nr:hypothetical protein MTR67_049590 [Solanum verrucosum]
MQGLHEPLHYHQLTGIASTADAICICRLATPQHSQTSHSDHRKLINLLFLIVQSSQKHRKSKCSLGIEENRDNVPTQEQTSDRNLCRRTRYAQMSPERKTLLLSQQREKRAESKRQKVLHQSNSTTALTITTSSLSPQQC